MIIVGLKGGLGNQMFQYAAGRRLAYHTNQKLLIDISFFDVTERAENVTLRQYELALMNIEASIATSSETANLKNIVTKGTRKILPWLNLNPYVKEKQFNFDPSLLALQGSRYLEGHWMSELYFSDISSLIHNDFKFKEPLPENGKKLLDQIDSGNSVCVQIRRGDYVNNPKIAEVHQTTTLNYFLNGIKAIKERLEEPVFFIFSDDPGWAEAHLALVGNIHFVEREFQGAGALNYLQLMTRCKHFVISNSTFGWWGAWLSKFNEKIVIAPKRWFNDETIPTQDVYPRTWIKI